MNITEEKAFAEKSKHIQELEKFVEKFLANFKECEYCGGTGDGHIPDTDCGICHGTGKNIDSIGILYVELPEEARALINKEKV